MVSMHITLPDAIYHAMQDKIANGIYQSPDEAISDALIQLENADGNTHLRQMLQEPYQQAMSGMVTPFSFDELFSESPSN